MLARALSTSPAYSGRPTEIVSTASRARARRADLAGHDGELLAGVREVVDVALMERRILEPRLEEDDRGGGVGVGEEAVEADGRAELGNGLERDRAGGVPDVRWLRTRWRSARRRVPRRAPRTRAGTGPGWCAATSRVAFPGCARSGCPTGPAWSPTWPLGYLPSGVRCTSTGEQRPMMHVYR